MKDRLNVHLHDGELLAEIDLVGELMIAAAESDEPLGDDTIDEVLGVGPDGDSTTETSVEAGETESASAD
ncbi:MAG: hypothetical protein ACRDO0_10595 [Nocardioidaceae bacterium]